MEIIKLLIINNESTEPNAALINDQGEEYPVFLESLTNTVYYPMLKESGYELVGLPNTFKKDNVSIFDLPVENYAASESVLEMMYNSIGAPLSYEELKKDIKESEVASIPMPPTDYTITNREEFIEYLNSIKNNNIDFDYLPINYFVAPQARFTLEEFIDEKNVEYVQIMSNRRYMSLQKFLKLFDWLKSKGMSANASDMDVLDAYFAWGMDGLNAPIISKRREQRPNVLNGNNNTPVPSYRWTQGFIDSYGNLLTPTHLSGIRWELPSNSPSYVSELTANMGVGETVVQSFRCKVPTDVTVMEGTNFNFYFNPDCALLLMRMYTSLRVKSPVGSGNLPLRLALPSNRSELLEYCYTEALARMLYNKRRCPVDVSSYKALSMCGVNPKSALNYVSTYDGVDQETKSADSIMIRSSDINAFLSGGDVAEEVKEYLQGILEGKINIDNIATAKQIEASVNVTNVFNEIYALHTVFNIPLSEIYKKFATITDTTGSVVFEARGLKHTIDVSPLRYSLNGYLSDIQNYDLKNAEKCSAFIYVTTVAREVGSIESRRHVGIEFFMVVKKPKVNDMLFDLQEKYVEKLNYTITNAAERAKLERLKYMFSLSRFFEIALKGTLTWPDVLGGAVDTFSFATQQEYRIHITRKIECLTTFCSYTVQGMSQRDLSLNLYCTNAYVTPEYVIPRKGNKIHECTFYALWNDYRRTSPEIYNKLVEVGVFPNGFEAWSVRYESEQFASRSLFDYNGDDTLLYYNRNATKEQSDWPADMEFTSVRHPIEYMFPGIEHDERIPAKLDVPRDGSPSVKIGGNRDITFDDMKDIMYPEVIDTYEDQYIRLFTALDAESFEICDDALAKMPDKECNFVVDATKEAIFLPDENRMLNFRQLTEVMDKYPIYHIYDRIYLFRTLDGKTWEVRI